MKKQSTTHDRLLYLYFIVNLSNVLLRVLFVFECKINDEHTSFFIPMRNSSHERPLDSSVSKTWFCVFGFIFCLQPAVGSASM